MHKHLREFDKTAFQNLNFHNILYSAESRRYIMSLLQKESLHGLDKRIDQPIFAHTSTLIQVKLGQPVVPL